MADMSLWSSTISDDKRLNEITMPGSHDATTYRGEDFTATRHVAPSKSITQSASIYEQCMMGSRFYDVRLKMDGGQVRGYHQKAGFGGLGASSQKILDDVNRFLGGRGSEFVILRISHTTAKTGIVGLVKAHAVAGKLLKASGNIAQMTVGDLRGKLICIFDSKAAAGQIDQAAGIHAFVKYASIGDSVNGLSTCGNFEGKKGIRDVIVDQLVGAGQHAGHSQGNHLFQLYWQQTGGDIEAHTRKTQKWKPDGRGLKISGGTHECTGYMINLLNGGPTPHGEDYSLQLKGADGKKVKTKYSKLSSTWADRRVLPNIISYDFVNKRTSEEIVRTNLPNVMDHLIEDLEDVDG